MSRRFVGSGIGLRDALVHISVGMIGAGDERASIFSLKAEEIARESVKRETRKGKWTDR